MLGLSNEHTFPVFVAQRTDQRKKRRQYIFDVEGAPKFLIQIMKIR